VDPGQVASDFVSKGPQTQARQSMRTRMLMMFPPFRIMSWATGGVFSSIYSVMLRSVNRGARSVLHVSTSSALGSGNTPKGNAPSPGGHVYSDRAGRLTDCGRAPSLCGRLDLVPPAADRHLLSALWRESERLVSHFAKPLQRP